MIIFIILYVTWQVTIQTLETQVQNLEDQLQAAHEMKRMMSIELESFHLAQAKLSSDLEASMLLVNKFHFAQAKLSSDLQASMLSNKFFLLSLDKKKAGHFYYL